VTDWVGVGGIVSRVDRGRRRETKCFGASSYSYVLRTSIDQKLLGRT